ncbi:ribosomal protein S18 acetylase RimI-like enzyme [Clostridium tetanomorphum]|uniref:GNAT family N-acetyltransferase n=1 Tax=Clostridium tetanomorphum TaxID=1553 RepID=A0A923EAZ0_CLOTT|nr:GNAT family N-acetyltransferase [Clostridium tetanomorphum]KAJ49310.1 acetyltransferase [Clostridium tetanomorphum DSM 665]KAJ53073.1 acetyltransferase [Clostridium tetanomorphum DSM 665]MBC2398389.1 GNAT family N-acetyltransferase [Clostridium tetanomorphum]MBP1865542.1 ribosomal protein S18 acetylase RimI-like enzyme [Clostridium tetanomorphum]NRS86488.1 ribosomal protein S18 acetylase RimI-like enzyme [Clostridium tetanomorphum]
MNDDFFIREFTNEDIYEVVQLWNNSCNDNFLYKPIKEEDFRKTFINNPYFQYEGTYLCISNSEIVGFANGIYRQELLPGERFQDIPGYITMVIVRKDKKGIGIGKALVETLENYLKAKGKKKINIDFFNPINISWYIPGSYKHDHPNAPGVDTNGEGYRFFKRIGYRERTKEVSMYRVLNRFFLDENMKNREIQLRQNSITVEYYNKNKHYGLEDFFDRLRNEYWRKDIKDNLSLKEPYPFLIAAHNNKICGFAGPLKIEKSGRGSFCGIGVEPNYEGKGIGKLLFFKLCKGFEEKGAEFMSLFTGINGNARKMYGDAGFKIVRTWALFEKEV